MTRSPRSSTKGGRAGSSKAARRARPSTPRPATRKTLNVATALASPQFLDGTHAIEFAGDPLSFTRAFSQLTVAVVGGRRVVLHHYRAAGVAAASTVPVISWLAGLSHLDELLVPCKLVPLTGDRSPQ